MGRDVIRQIGSERLGFAYPAAEVSGRARYKCEYCCKYMLASVDVYLSTQIDHIIPNGEDDLGDLNLGNRALSCQPCNKLKWDWDPTTETGGGIDRDRLIEAAKKYVKEKRKESDKKRLRHQEIVDSCNCSENCCDDLE